MLIECDNCGAPLDIQEGVTTSKCRYCGKTSRVQGLRTVALQTPKDWQPPKTWTPPEHMPAPHAPLAYHSPAAARKAVALVGSMSGLITLAVGGAVAYNALHGSAAALRELGNSGAIPAQITDALNLAKKQVEGAVAVAGNVAPPVVCSGNERIALTQKVIASSGTPVIASGNCEVTLIACTVTGSVAVLASDNAHVRVEGGTVTASTAAAIKASGNAEVTITSGAIVTGEPALSAVNNSQIELQKSTALGRIVAATTSQNASIDARTGTLQGSIAGTRKVKR